MCERAQRPARVEGTPPNRETTDLASTFGLVTTPETEGLVWPHDRRVRAFKDNLLRPVVVRMLTEDPETLWVILNSWGFGPESYASESDRRKWHMASCMYELTDADATAALYTLLGDVATEQEGVYFLKDEYRRSR